MSKKPKSEDVHTSQNDNEFQAVLRVVAEVLSQRQPMSKAKEEINAWWNGLSREEKQEAAPKMVALSERLTLVAQSLHGEVKLFEFDARPQE